MATTILQYAEGDTVFTSEFDSISATTDKAKVTVTVISTYPSPVELFKTDLYSFDGKVTLIAPGGLVEEYLRRKELHQAFIKFCFDDAEVVIRVRYCEYRLGQAAANLGGILSVLSNQRVHLDGRISFSAFRKNSLTHVTMQGVGHDADGRMVASAVVDLGPLDAAGTTYWDVTDLVTLMLEYSEEASDTPPVDICYFTLSYNGSSKNYYIVKDDDHYLTFRFRNIFNMPETIDIPGILQKKTEVDRELAVCSGVTTFYDQSSRRTYEMQSAALPAEEAEMIDQLFNSRAVKLLLKIAGDEVMDVLITEHTCEIDDNDESLATVKFTFRFPTGRICLFGDEIDAFRTTDRVFTDEFTNPFA